MRCEVLHIVLVSADCWCGLTGVGVEGAGRLPGPLRAGAAGVRLVRLQAGRPVRPVVRRAGLLLVLNLKVQNRNDS